MICNASWSDAQGLSQFEDIVLWIGIHSYCAFVKVYQDSSEMFSLLQHSEPSSEWLTG